MILLKLGDYVPPDLSTYDVDLSDVNGEQSQVEDGTTYIEQVRAEVPTIKVGWTNLKSSDVVAITNAVKNDVTQVTYFYGDLKIAEMTTSNRSLKLKHIEEGCETYWDLSFTLNG